ncbi:MAG: hypothetical protein U0414_42880 [Polyangiaceae bacterium]
MSNGTTSHSGTVGSEGGVVATPSRILPIIVVPGIGGTRLKDPVTHELVWNPMGSPMGNSPGAMAFDTDRMAEIDSPLEPVEFRPSLARVERAELVASTGRGLRQAESLRLRYDVLHYSNLIPDFYGNLVRRLHAELPAMLEPYDYRPMIFCCGYDFRQDNATSAARLGRVAAEAALASHDQPPILIVHSMGGHVARHYLRVLHGEARALFLCATPSIGAPEPYLYLKRGMTVTPVSSVDAALGAVGLGSRSAAARAQDSLMDAITRWFMTGGLSEESSRSFYRNMPGIFQLMPNAIYGRHVPHFLQFDERLTGIPASGPTRRGATFDDCSDVRRLYTDVFTGLIDVPADRQKCTTNIELAMAFHEALIEGGRMWIPPNTYIVHGGGLETISGASITGEAVVSERGQNYVRIGSAEDHHVRTGDNSVPAVSACPPADLLSTPLAREPTPAMAAAAHRDFPNDDRVVRYMLGEIANLVAMGSLSGR